MRVAALYSSPRLPSRYDARVRRRSRGTVHARGARRETAAHGYFNVVGAVRRYKIARERERYSSNSRCVDCTAAAPAATADVALAGDAGSAVMLGDVVAPRHRGPLVLSGSCLPPWLLLVHASCTGLMVITLLESGRAVR